jgi:predicted NBD/HSP70 family sugar kinase
MAKSHQNHSSTPGTNLEHARSHNRRAVLEAVRLAGSLSRAEIARRTSLTIQTISNIVTELEDKGFLLAGQINRNPRGQPSIPYSINPKGASSIGFHIARHEVIGVLTDLKGKVLAQKEVTAEATTPQIATPIVTRMFDELIKTAKVSKRSLLGAGVALPARFGLGTLSTEGPTGLPGWNDAAVRSAFATQLNVPVFIENDAVAAAIGEHHYGAARGINSFVMLYLDEGLGAGLFLNGHLFKGALSNAGEIGHMIIEANGRSCPCGNRGCLERYVSLQAAFEFLGANSSHKISSPRDVANMSALDLKGWILDAAPKLAIAINILETVLDAETILIGGLASFDIVESLIACAQPLHISASTRPDRKFPRVMAGRVGRHATALGAAALPIFDEMNPNFDVLLKQSLPSVAAL